MSGEQIRIPQQEVLIHERSPFVRKQARVLQASLNALKLGIGASTVPELRDASFFSQRPVMALSGGVDEDQLALIIALSRNAAVAAESSFIPLLVCPTPQGSGLLIDDSTGAIKTDSFWFYENNRFKYIIPSKPIIIDELNVGFDSSREDPTIQAQRDPHERLFALSNNKLTTKTILQQAGIPVPRGITIEAHEQPDTVAAHIREFVDALPHRSGFVLKELEGAHGIGVGLFPWEDLDNVTEIAKGLSENGERFLFEERIKPKPLTTTQKAKLGFTEDEEVDYNFRILVDLDREDPQAIDAEMRYRKYSFAPVNLTHREKPALAARVDILDDPDLVQRLYETAEQATKALCQAALAQGETITGLAGVDVTLSEDGEIIPVFEVNTGGVGGIATLTKLDERPLTSVEANLASIWSSRLNRSYTQRRPEIASKLRRLPYNDEDLIQLYRADVIEGNYSHAQEILLTVGHRYSDQYYIMSKLFFLAEKLGDFTHIERYVDEIIARDKFDRITVDAWIFKSRISSRE